MSNEEIRRIPLDSYKIDMTHEIINVEIFRDTEGFSHYTISVRNISKSTTIILRKIREEFISKINVGKIDFEGTGEAETIKEKFVEEIIILLKQYFPTADKKTTDLLVSELIRQNIGLGDLEVLLKDDQLEEIAVNNSKDPVYVYHKKYGWLKTNIVLGQEDRVRHYATIVGRDVGKELTLLKPLMDAHLLSGDRVNATLSPISSAGNTITIRKFAVKPWTITDFLRNKTISYETAALIWLAVQNELSVLISGGTGSGKTSMLNVVCSFIPHSQRIVSIEDTREITLPGDLHWIPLETRLPNPEGKGEVTMLDLVVNSLRMRPDRIIMGEVRRQKEAEVLFEAMHTGHSVYATIHANNTKETINRLTNPPLNVPKNLLSAISLVLVQNRNRRSGTRKTSEISEVLSNGDAEVLMRYDINKDKTVPVMEPKQLYDTLELYAGISKEDVKKDLSKKMDLLRWLVDNNVNSIHEVGAFFRKYYAEQQLK